MRPEQYNEIYDRMLQLFKGGKEELRGEYTKKFGRCAYDSMNDAVTALWDKQKWFPEPADIWPAYEEAESRYREAAAGRHRDNNCPDCFGHGLAHHWEKRPNGKWYSGYCLCNCEAGKQLERQYEESDARLKRQHKPGISMADLVAREKRGHVIVFNNEMHPPEFEMPQGEADPDLVAAMNKLMETVAGSGK